MANSFFTLMIDDEIVRFEKNRIIEIEPYESGTKITLEASHTSEEPLIYFTTEAYDRVMQAYLN